MPKENVSCFCNMREMSLGCDNIDPHRLSQPSLCLPLTSLRTPYGCCPPLAVGVGHCECPVDPRMLSVRQWSTISHTLLLYIHCIHGTRHKSSNTTRPVIRRQTILSDTYRSALFGVARHSSVNCGASVTQRLVIGGIERIDYVHRLVQYATKRLHCRPEFICSSQCAMTISVNVLLCYCVCFNCIDAMP